MSARLSRSNSCFSEKTTEERKTTVFCTVFCVKMPGIPHVLRDTGRGIIPHRDL